MEETENNSLAEPIDSVQVSSTIDMDLLQKALEAGVLPPGFEIVYSCSVCPKQFKSIDDCNKHFLEHRLKPDNDSEQIYVDKLLEQELSGYIIETQNSQDNEEEMTNSCETQDVVNVGNIGDNAEFDASAHFERLQRLGTVIQEQRVDLPDLSPPDDITEQQIHSLHVGEVDIKPDIDQLNNRICAAGVIETEMEPDKTETKVKTNKNHLNKRIVTKKSVRKRKEPDHTNPNTAINDVTSSSTDDKQNSSPTQSETVISKANKKIVPCTLSNYKNEPDLNKTIEKRKKKNFLDRISKIAPIKTKLQDKDEDVKVYEFRDAEMEQRIREAKLALVNKKRTCPYCKKLFDDPMDVLRHKREAHAFQKQYFPAAELEKYYHVNDKSKCPICNRPIKGGFPSMYYKHLLTHKEEYSFQCKICNMMFRREDHKQQHEARHIV